jgi:hypothetical protein
MISKERHAGNAAVATLNETEARFEDASPAPSLEAV